MQPTSSPVVSGTFWRTIALLAACASLAIVASHPVLAQQSGAPAKAAQAADVPVPAAKPYTPATPEAPDAAPSATDLFAAVPPQDDTFAGVPLPTPRSPSTAADRRGADEAALPIPAPVAEEELATGAITSEGRIGLEDDLRLSRESERQRAIEQRDRAGEESPFAPVGVRFGTFILRPSVEQGVTATSNAASAVNGKSALLSESTLRLNALSDWSRHSASIDAYGSFRRSLSDYELEETRLGLDAVLNLDLADELTGRAAVGYQRRPETASSPVVIEGTLEQPTLDVLTGSLGLRKELGKARFGITGSAEREMYGDADLSTGGTLSQADRDATLYTLVLRGGYAISPAFTPFVEGEIGRRAYEQDVDSSGYERSSDRLGARAGVEVALSEKLTGEVSAGYIRESFEDDRLKPISGPSIDADLLWSPMRGTTVGLNASTTVEGATAAGESGSVLHSAKLRLEREVRADLTTFVALGGGYRDYSGSPQRDTLLDAEVGATWWLNRYAGLTGRLRHESLKSNAAFRDYDTNSVFLGVKVQR